MNKLIEDSKCPSSATTASAGSDLIKRIAEQAKAWSVNAPLRQIAEQAKALSDNAQMRQIAEQAKALSDNAQMRQVAEQAKAWSGNAQMRQVAEQAKAWSQNSHLSRLAHRMLPPSLTIGDLIGELDARSAERAERSPSRAHRIR
jgi:hypothetical protein